MPPVTNNSGFHAFASVTRSRIARSCDTSRTSVSKRSIASITARAGNASRATATARSTPSSIKSQIWVTSFATGICYIIIGTICISTAIGTGHIIHTCGSLTACCQHLNGTCISDITVPAGNHSWVCGIVARGVSTLPYFNGHRLTRGHIYYGTGVCTTAATGRCTNKYNIFTFSISAATAATPSLKGYGSDIGWNDPSAGGGEVHRIRVNHLRRHIAMGNQ